MKGYSTFPKAWNYWRITIILFSVTFRTIVGWGISVYSIATANWAEYSTSKRGIHIKIFQVKYPGILWVIISIISIMSCRQHEYPWPSLATPPYRSSLPAGPQGYTPYPHRAAVCRFELVALTLARPCERVHRSTSLMSSSLLLQ